MNFIFPILAALLQAGSFILDKVVLSIRRVSFKTYMGVSFPLIFIITLIIFLIFRPPLSMELLSGNLRWLLLISIGMATITNLMFYRALDDDGLGEIQTFDLLHNIPIIIFASVIFSDERNFIVIIPALVASLAVIWSHWEKGHPFVRKKTRPYLLWILIIGPLEAAAFKEILAIWDPISLQFVRELIIVPILGFMYADTLRRVSPKSFGAIFFTGAILTLGSILFFVSYAKLGVIYTTLIFTLQPLLTYLGALLLLKEKFYRKKFIAFLIVLISIAVAQAIG